MPPGSSDIMFSVLMSIYGKERPEYFLEALQSLENQELRADEVVLVIDGPIPNELYDLIEAFRAKLNIRTVVLPENQGLRAALNKGLEACAHDLVARMDTDDVALPNRFARQLPFMIEHPEVVASSALIEEFDDGGDVLGVRFVPAEQAQIMEFAKMRSPLSHPAAIYRRSIVQSVGGYPDAFPEDHALWSLMLARGFQMANIQEVLLRMRANNEFIRRRGKSFFRGQLGVIRFQRKIGFISSREAIAAVAFRAFLHLSPAPMRRWMYRLARE